MAPEVARGDRPRGEADVWSSCCMLLHMLNGRHPWIRYYSHPLCLQPPPLWEVPSTCNNFTAKVFRAGLQKDPDRRASAKELRRKTTKALRAGRCHRLEGRRLGPRLRGGDRLPHQGMGVPASTAAGRLLGHRLRLRGRYLHGRGGAGSGKVAEE
uniref:Protein kinase domain-containing protein n=1 Tax=Cyclopterus lumpus TaxID=8103 RepID=A0A8C2WHP0_CYCLU